VVPLSTVVHRRQDVAVRTTATGALLVDLGTGRCWQLNRVGAAFLSQLETPKALSLVFGSLQGRYSVPNDVLEADLCRLAGELLDAGLIERVE
jgi:hypothetical protein